VAIALATVAAGLGLLAFAFVAHRRRSTTAEPSTPRWMGRLDHLTILAAPLIAFLVQPWPLIGIGGLAVTKAELNQPATIAVLVAFCLLCSASILTLEVWSLVRPVRAQARTDQLREFLAHHSHQLVVALSALLGLWLVGRGTFTLLTS
jgi:hypothetical protein